MNTDKIEITWADPSSLKPNNWNTNVVSPENERKLDESIDKFGMFKPILVRELPDGTLEILGGEHRADRAAKSGKTRVPIINLGPMTDTRAKEIGLVDNGRYGADDVLALAELLSGLGDQENLSSFLPYSDVELNSIFSSVDIDMSELDIDGDEDISPELPAARPVQTHQVMRFKVPVDDAHKITERIERVINEQNFTDSDSLTNAGDALVYLFNEIE